MVPVALVLSGSLAHAGWNLLASRVRGDGRLFVWAYSSISLALVAPVAIIWAIAGDIAWQPAVIGASFISATTHTAYALFLQAAYARSPMNVTYPVARGLAPCLVAFIGVALWHEYVSPLSWIGIALIVLGVAVVSYAPTASDAVSSGLRWGVLIATAITAYTLWDAFSVDRLGIDPLVFHACMALWQFVLMSVLCRGRRTEALALARRYWLTAFGVALLIPVSYVLVLVAMTLAPISLVAPLRSTSIVMGALGAWLLLGESHGIRRLVGAAVVMVGVAGLVAG